MCRQILIHQSLKTFHVLGRLEDFQHIGGSSVFVIFGNVLRCVESRTVSSVGTEIVALSNGTFSGNGTICHLRGNITGEHIRMITVFGALIYNERVRIIAKVGFGYLRHLCNNVVYQCAPFHNGNSFFRELFDRGQPERILFINSSLCQKEEFYVRVCFAEEIQHGVDSFKKFFTRFVGFIAVFLNKDIIIVSVSQIALMINTVTATIRRATVKKVVKAVSTKGPVGDVGVFSAVCSANLFLPFPVTPSLLFDFLPSFACFFLHFPVKARFCRKKRR